MVARLIFEAKPEKHVDIGSRLDGFVAHVASFREIEVFDIRPMTTTIPGVVFRQVNLMQPDDLLHFGNRYCDSLSCLHALEHFGLGRYSDPVNPQGYAQGFSNMADLLKQGGVFYLSTPIGKERVEFNANWVFDPRTILALAQDNGMVLQSLTLISAGGKVNKVIPNIETLRTLAEMPYHLGVFVFSRV